MYPEDGKQFTNRSERSIGQQIKELEDKLASLRKVKRTKPDVRADMIANYPMDWILFIASGESFNPTTAPSGLMGEFIALGYKLGMVGTVMRGRVPQFRMIQPK